MSIKYLDKYCVICGDRAHGFNFNAITCQSCKAFFRRSALRYNDLKCYFNGNCSIDSITRKFCKKCRLDKCFGLGMRKDCIFTDEKLMDLRKKIAENRQKRQQKGPKNCQNINTINKEIIFISGYQRRSEEDIEKNMNEGTDSPASDSTSSLDWHQLSTRSNASPLLIQQNSDLYNQCCVYSYIRDNSSDNQYIDNTGVQSYVTNGQYFNNNTQEYNKSNSSEENSLYSASNSETTGEEPAFSTFPFNQLISIYSNTNELNDCEINRLNELSLAAMDINCTVIAHKAVKITSELSDLLNVIKLMAYKSEQFIKNLVVMSKRISAYKYMCPSDQLVLMKAGCFEIIQMRSFVTYNFEHDFWRMFLDPDNATMVKLEVYKDINSRYYEAQQNYLQAFKEECNNDHNIINLLMIIVLFNPDRPNIVHKESVKLEQKIYIYLLRRYFLSKYKPKYEAELKFMKYMRKLRELNILAKELSTMYNANSQDVGPLVLEILDINTNNDIVCVT